MYKRQSLYAANEGYLDDIEINKVGDFEAGLHAHMRSNHQDLLDQVNDSGDYDDNIEAAYKSAVEAFKANGSW